jgi:hypothetical protein
LFDISSLRVLLTVAEMRNAVNCAIQFLKARFLLVYGIHRPRLAARSQQLLALATKGQLSREAVRIERTAPG